jgi:hypothetical protein
MIHGTLPKNLAPDKNKCQFENHIELFLVLYLL